MKKIYLISFLFFSINTIAQEVNLSSEKLWAERTSATKYVIHKNDNTKWKIFVGANPQKIDWKSTPKKLKDSLVFEVLPTDRLFFGAIYKKDTIIFSERRLWVENAPNFRDLGGIKTNNGKTVAWGKLFRCGDMGKFSVNDLTILQKENIRNVIDFRNEQEIKQSPDIYPSDFEVNRVWTSISPSNGDAMKKIYTLIGNPKTTPAEAEAVLEEFYTIMPDNIKNYAPFFETLLNSKLGEASLFHCTAGKDRTGLGSALILSVLGVSEEIIIEEYYLSNRYTQYLAKAGMMSQLKPAIAKVLAGVEPKYIRSTLNKIKTKYGSVLKMLETELGIDETKRQYLIQKYTF
jgi:protein-tyrosine phosphatase